MKNTVIEVRGLKKSFGDLNVLNHISFDVVQGEVITFLGPSGSGKTTLLNCITGIEKKWAGQIQIDGLTLKEYLLSNRIGMVTQKYGNYPWLTVYQNIELGKDCSLNQSNDSILQIVESIELQGFESYYPDQLSGGMQQRVAIGRAIAQNSDILAMDEPFGALDYMTRTTLQGLLKQVNEKYGKTILFITHDVEEAIFISDKIIILSKTPTVIAKEITVPTEIKQSTNSKVRYSSVFVKLRSEIENILSNLEELKKIDQIFSSRAYDRLKNLDYWNTFIANECRLKYEKLSREEQIDLSSHLLDSRDNRDVIIGSLLHKDVPYDVIKEKLTQKLIGLDESDFEMAYFLVHSITSMKTSEDEKRYYRQMILDNLQQYLFYEKRYFTLKGILDDSVVIRLVESRFKGDSIVNLENKGWLLLISSLAHNDKRAVVSFLKAVIEKDKDFKCEFSSFDEETVQILLNILKNE